jgi:hypothetical protein
MRWQFYIGHLESVRKTPIANDILQFIQMYNLTLLTSTHWTTRQVQETSLFYVSSSKESKAAMSSYPFHKDHRYPWRWTSMFLLSLIADVNIASAVFKIWLNP